MLKVVALSYKRLSAVMRSLDYKVPQGVTFRIIDAQLPEVKAISQELERNNEVDLYISAGGSAWMLSQISEKPLVEIAVTGFDILNALQEASLTTGGVAVITYQDSVRDMNPTFKALGIHAVHKVYMNAYEIEGLLLGLQDQGVEKIVSSSLVLEKALELGMRAHFIYSPVGVRDAIEQCFQAVVARQAEAERAYTLQMLLNYAYGGIIAVDAQGAVTEFNFSAENTLGIAKRTVLGKKIDKVLPGFSTKEIMDRGEEEIGTLKTVNRINILANSIPITVGNKASGMVITFQDIGTIKESEKTIRRSLQQKGFYAKTNFSGILGHSKTMIEIKEQARLYARSNATILITGESGTGKELFAQAIHNASTRAHKPFVAINCASLPSNLLQSELFGYAEGSFTGAKKGGKPGLFEMADKGTLFLDEIGEIDKATQSLLLRTIETREVMRIGGEQIFSTDFRIIAATNRDIWSMVEAGDFREDMYYRLSTLQIDMPPLRERREDIPLLAKAFLREMRGDVPPAIVEALANEPLLLGNYWNGNIRELRNIIERFSALFQGKEDPLLLFRKVLLRSQQKGKVKNFETKERNDILAALNEAKGNKTMAAKTLRMSRTTLWRKIQEMNDQGRGGYV